MSETPAVPATEAAMRAAWTEVCMVEYRITGDMMKATEFADRIEKTYRDQVRAETLAGAAKKLRQHAKTMGNQEWATGTYIGADMIDPTTA